MNLDCKALPEEEPHHYTWGSFTQVDISATLENSLIAEALGLPQARLPG